MKEKIEMLIEKCGKPVGILLIAITAVVVLGIAIGWFCFVGWLMMLLWNWLAVGIFGATTVSYWTFVKIAFVAELVRKLIAKRKENE